MKPKELYQAGKAQASQVFAAKRSEILQIFDEASTLQEGWRQAEDKFNEAERKSREYSSFELFSQQLNKRLNAGELWAAYEAGIYQGFVEEVESQILA